MRLRAGFLLLLPVALAGCTRLIGTSRATFGEGSYRTAGFSDHPRDRVYVQVSNDTLIVSRRVREGGVETLAPEPLIYPREQATPPAKKVVHYYQPSFDVDVLTLPFKYRPAVSDYPAQLNTTFNAAVYFGYRTDVYRVSYHRKPTQLYRRHTTHFGTGIGVFGGIGSTPVNPWVTNPSINSEYDGFVVPFGIATIVAVNDLSFGITLGTDHLMDEDRMAWIYRRKLWVGASFGINLN